ncbi:MAG: hypothetical protein ACHQX4_06660 [Gemmatimonadales bacterium]
MQSAPDPNIIVPVFGMLTGVAITGMIVMGPIGRTIGDIVRHLFGADRKDAAVAAGELDELRDRLDTISHQLAELAERQDFTERMLAQVRKDKALTGGTDVAG